MPSMSAGARAVDVDNLRVDRGGRTILPGVSVQVASRRT